MLSLRHAIAQRLRADSALDYDPESEIVVTVGAAEALLVALLATLDSGDEVMLPEPGWPNAVGCAYIAGAIPVAVPLHKENGFQIDPNDVRRLLSRRTKAIFINSPHNPTGAITQPDVMSDLAEIANASNLVVISDEVYGRLYYDRPPVSIATVPGMRDRTLVIGSVSKTYAMTGWRIGWVAGPASILRHVHAIHQASVTSATSFAQVGAAAALADNQECVSALVAELSARKDILVSSLLQACPTCIIPPRGGLFAYLDVRKWADSGEQFADLLLRSDGIAVVPGTAFGPSQKDFVRLSFGAARSDLLPASQILVRRLQGSQSVGVRH
jgi:aspartate/methionine/tyrosine aminotransferase